MLNLLRVDTEDFMGFAGKNQINLDLDPGLYFLTGKNLDNPRLGANGCGKSTLFNAVYWCLTGDLMDLSKPGDEVKPWNATKKKVKVRTWFELGNNYYSVLRQRAPNGLFLREGADGEDRPVDDATILNLLGLSKESLKRTIFLGQFSDLFLDLTPTDQSRFFNDILDLDLWVDAAKMATTKRVQWERTHADIGNTISNKTGRLEASEGQVKEAKQQFQLWRREQAKRIEAADERVHQLTLDHSAAQSQFEAAVDPATMSRDLEAKREELRKKEGDLRAGQVAADRLAREVKALDSEVARLKKEKQRFEEARDGSTCPECGQKVKKAHFDEKIVELTAAIAAKEKEADKVDADHKDQLDTNSEWAEEVGTLEDEIKPQVEKQSAAMEAYAELKARAMSLKSELDGAKGQLARLKQDQNPHATTEERLADQIADLTGDLKKLEQEQRDATAHSEAYGELERAFKEIRLSLIDEALAELQVTVGEYAEQLGLVGWSIKFATERELRSGGTSVGLTTTLYPPGQEGKGIDWHVYSGGERQRWQLAVTFGLSEVLLSRAGLDSNIEVLDEPSRSMSAEGLVDLTEHLRERAHEHKKAIILVDHHILDRGLFDHTMVVVRENGVSRLEAA